MFRCRFGYQGFSRSENYRQKYGVGGGSRGDGNREVDDDDLEHGEADRVMDLSSLSMTSKGGKRGGGTPTTTTTGYLRSSPSSAGGPSLFNIPKDSSSKKMSKNESRMYRWLESHDLQEVHESLHDSGFTSIESLAHPSIQFTDADLVEMGVLKKGLRMQFIALSNALRSRRLVATVVRGEGMRPFSLFSCGPGGRRVTIRFMGVEKVTSAASGLKPTWNKTFVFPYSDRAAVSKSDILITIEGGGRRASCSVGAGEVGEREEGIDGKPYPVVNNKTGGFEGCVWLKLHLEGGGGGRGGGGVVGAGLEVGVGVGEGVGPDGMELFK